MDRDVWVSFQGSRRLVLFLVAILFPTMGLVWLGQRILDQERELEVRRWAEAQRQSVRELGEHLYLQLEQIKLEVAHQGAEADPLDIKSLHPAVVWVGRVEEDQLRLPWDLYATRSMPASGETDDAFDRAVRSGEQAEFGRTDPNRALEQYRVAAQAARTASQRAYAGLLQARVLNKTGRTSEATTAYLYLLQVEPLAQDEYGIPLSFYAMAALLDKPAFLPEVLACLATTAEAPPVLGPSAVRMMDLLIQMVVSQSPADSLQPALEHVQAHSIARQRRVAQSERLKQVFPRVLEPLQGLDDRSLPDWFPFGEDLWFVTAWPGPEGDLAVAVDAARLLQVAGDLETFHQVGLGAPSLDMLPGGAGGWILPRFPDVQVSFESLGASGPDVSTRARKRLFLMGLILLLGIALLSSYLLWRDIQREAHLATLRAQFVSSVSHELKTPLTAIRMYAETLRLRPAERPIQGDYLDTIINESERLTRLLNNVLDFSKMERGLKQYHLEEGRVQEVLKNAVRALDYSLRQQRFTLATHIDESVPPLLIDQDAIEQVVLNLLTNAMKYSGDRRAISLHLEQQNGLATIRVVDQGIGIDPADQQRIFEKFCRVEAPANRRIPGAGLGLSVVRHVVDAHRGHLQVQSDPGQGSTFSIHLPLLPSC